MYFCDLKLTSHNKGPWSRDLHEDFAWACRYFGTVSGKLRMTGEEKCTWGLVA
ncbi:hypothetical protein MANES_08G054850v8 [Manihot esculenta]|uniref:Uncharacterized protein n=1 Tax=Manihot esculenta TaxID=3983 RepID=A0ACB7H9W0_MANES|nr:hypothetical protein MANES_08G054850v8 [Manihot esculenta]